MIYLSVSTCDEIGRFTHEAGVRAALFSEVVGFGYIQATEIPDLCEEVIMVWVRIASAFM